MVPCVASRRESPTLDAFLLSREWYDGADGLEIVLWGRAAEGPVRARITDQEAVMFILRGTEARAHRRASPALATREGHPVDAKPHERFLMERFITGSMRLSGKAVRRDGVLHFENPSIKRGDWLPALSMLSLDLETDGLSGPLLSAALATSDRERVLVRGAGRDHDAIVFVPDERALLETLFAEIRAIDPDVLVGWNVVDFDLTVLERRALEHRVPFAIGRAGERARVVRGATSQQPTRARVPGRIVLDGIATLKSATHRFERFTLDHVAHELLGRGKKIAPVSDPVAEIRRMHAEDVDALAAYNLEDCHLVLGIFARVDLLGFAVERARLTGLAMDRQGGSVAAFDHLYLPRLHRKGIVAPDVGDVSGAPSPGGHVLDSVPGLYRDVVSFDFRSLYPSIIRTYRIDPFGLYRPGENPLAGADGALFARVGSILPELIETLHDARSTAMASKNEPLSRAIKILMNSFYGVLGTPGCRFFDPLLPTSITRRGHLIIERARSFFVARGLAVLYGDTDSLFVHLERAPDGPSTSDRGRALAAELTETLAREIREEHGVESHLELRFESHYLRFLVPTTRGTVKGSKKRYAGTVRRADGSIGLVVRGLEAVRTDWTPLARRVQRELLRRVFLDEPFEEWLVELTHDLASGRLDGELVYRKRLRRDLDDYARDGAPPHVRAARMREGGAEDDAHVDYVVTTTGPEPRDARHSPIDHGHYLDKQLAPACDIVLPFLGTSFERVTGRQQDLF
jgi:DNA polymerase-2